MRRKETIMKTVKVKEVEIGRGIPKICIPITGTTREEILLDVEEILKQKPDLAEWRADCYKEGENGEKVLEMLKTITDRLGQIPLLFTFRTAKEGGSRQISFEDYVKLLNLAAAAGLTDLVDVEVFFQKTSTPKLVKQLQDQGVKVVASNHHFEGTPSRTELVEILENLRESGADILKMAVMPKNFQDLLRLMEVTQEGREKYERPLITMSMGKIGFLSRICGEITGSAVTFAAGRNASAPGQGGAEPMRNILNSIHEILKDT